MISFDSLPMIVSQREPARLAVFSVRLGGQLCKIGRPDLICRDFPECDTVMQFATGHSASESEATSTLANFFFLLSLRKSVSCCEPMQCDWLPVNAMSSRRA